MIEKVVALALVPPWIACTTGWALFVGLHHTVGLVTMATWGQLPPKGRRLQWH